MDRMTFLLPIHVGELLTLKAAVNAAWRTSMEVGVRVEAENPRTGEVRHTNTAYLTMVALDDDGRPARACRRCVRQTPEEQRREREAQVRRANRSPSASRSAPSARPRASGLRGQSPQSDPGGRSRSRAGGAP